jgi:hypothetical protein
LSETCSDRIIMQQRNVATSMQTNSVELSRFLRQTVKTQNPSNGELSHGIVS